MQTVDEIVNAFGGPAKLARALGVRRYARVTDWKYRGSIPAGAWADIVDAARKHGVRGVTLETLAHIHRRSEERAA
jgi:hypothetical protein